MGTLAREFGRRIRELRQEARLTQEKLAAKAGMDYKYLGGVERGERNLTMDNAERIVRALGAEPFEVFAFCLDKGSSGDADRQRFSHLLKGADPATRAHLIRLVKHILDLTRKR